MTDDDTCQLMFNPYRVSACPTHCCIAIPAKLDPVTCRDGEATANVAGPTAPKTPIAHAKTSTATRGCLLYVMEVRRSAEATIDIVLSPFVCGLLEHDLGRTVLDDLSWLVFLRQKERAVVRDPVGLLHVVGHDHDGDFIVD